MKATESVTPPRLIKQVDPVLPKKFKRNGKIYDVTVHFVIDTEGIPVKLTIVKPAALEDLNKNALAAVSEYRFAPAIYEGKPVAVEMNVNLNFRPMP